MHISLHITAAILLLSGCSLAHSNEHIFNYCNHIGSFAAGVSLNQPHGLTNKQLEAEAGLIAIKTSFHYNETKSKIFEVANDPKMKNLTAAEFAGFHFFWCVYDIQSIQYGTGAFDLQGKLIDLYHRTITPK